eukprot:CAMPEP_0185034772 /NCGR_PEP_ID=MMETSP1103-20130426/24919_1 /TAXON_ID=36769 /ORGANISM="Paraphysomonas bandaiensis, Strain Caron Lab Isolate" /LENGTH=435 /DNA_ID=CAMNT_0027571557 /DNA_START=102 /DNA_END=1406 /DNA_ORIENTATION=+
MEATTGQPVSSLTRAGFDPFCGSNQDGEFESIEEFEKYISDKYGSASEIPNMNGWIFQEVDFTNAKDYFLDLPFDGASFWGCVFPPGVTDNDIRSRGAKLVTSNPTKLPFKPMRAFLYSQEELAASDSDIYKYWLENSNSFESQLFYSIHDFSIMDALMDYAEGKSFVAICGGHAMRRSDVMYGQLMELGNKIAHAGFICCTGGGPGAMEASNLGSYLAGIQHAKRMKTRSEQDVSSEQDDDHSSESILSRARELIQTHPSPPDEPEYKNPKPAQAVLDALGPSTCYSPSLGIPTWRYGHEPPNLFTAYHAKFFQNSLREAVLLELCYGGLIITPGGPGTMQEIFQAACRNAYSKEGHDYPMVFFGVEFWRENGVWDLVQKQARKYSYTRMLLLSDSVDEIMDHLVRCADEKGLSRISDFSELCNPYWFSKSSTC